MIVALSTITTLSESGQDVRICSGAVTPPGGDTSERDGSIQQLIGAHRCLLRYSLEQFPGGPVNVFDRDLRDLYDAGAGHCRRRCSPVQAI